MDRIGCKSKPWDIQNVDLRWTSQQRGLREWLRKLNRAKAMSLVPKEEFLKGGIINSFEYCQDYS